MLMHSALCPIQVGRDTETRVLEQTLQGVRSSGDGRLVLIAGEAGAGKSRLVAEATRIAAAAGLVRFDGNCSPDAGIPYEAFVTAIRRRTRNLETTELAELFAGPASLAAALLPEVAEALGGTTSARVPEDVHAAVWRLLARLVKPNGALLVLEDLHWADTDSLRLLSYLARETDGLPLWIVGTYRSDEMHRRHPLAAVVAELSRERRFEPISLKPLDAEQVRAMLSAIFDGTEVGDEFANVILERTEGNPFFIEELAKVMIDRGDVFRTGGEWERREIGEMELPLSVRETLLDRARTMAAASLRVLQLAAVYGVQLDLAVLERASGETRELVEKTIGDGLGLQILAEHRESGGSVYAFRHALSREAFADELVGPDRRRAHVALAEATEAVHAGRLDAVAASLAEHYAAAGEAALAFDFSLRAARTATTAMAWNDADKWYDQALRLLGPTDDRRLGLALEACGDDRTMSVSRMKLAFAEEARRMAATAADPISEANAISVISAYQWLAGNGQESIALLRDARELIRGRDDKFEAWLLRRLTRIILLGDQLQPDDPLLREGIELAQRSGNLSALSGLLGTRMMLEELGSRFDTTYQEAVAAARAANDLDSEANAHINYGYVSFWCGAFGPSREALRKGTAITERISPSDRYGRAGEAWVMAMTGDYAGAESAASDVGNDSALPSRVVALTALAEIAQRRGTDGSSEIVEELWTLATQMGEAQRSVPAVSARAREILLGLGIDAALPLFQQVLGHTVTGNIRASHWPFSPDLAQALAAEGRVAELNDWADAVERITAVDPNSHNLAARALVDAHRSAAQGLGAEAAAGFADAIARYRAMPCPARVVEALVGLARVQVRAGDSFEGEATLAEAESIATSIGAHVLVESVRAARTAMASRSVLATLLFTDIVGSTESAVRLGDRAWREVLERHHSLVRRELARTDGREIDTAGDGFLVAFDSPTAGVRCALAIEEALEAAGIRIRAGLHTGECQQSGSKLSGLTVHIAARVSQQAEAGEVLVSSTVRELLAGSGISFLDRGKKVLKGIPDEWHLYAVARS
jgi:class 3 adenylate cyclase